MQREHSCQVDKIRCGDIVQISQVYFKRWKDRSTNEVRFGGNHRGAMQLLMGNLSEVDDMAAISQESDMYGEFTLEQIW